MDGQQLRYDIVGDSASFQRAAAAAQQAGLNATRQITAGMKESMAAARGMQVQIDRSTATMRQMLGVNDNLAKYRRQNLTFQLFDVGQTIGTVGVLRTLIQQGPQIVQIYAGQGGVRAALADTRGIVGSLIGQFGRFGPAVAAAAAAAAAGLVGLQHEINRTSDVEVSLGDVFKATWQTAADGVHDLVKPAIDELSPWIESMWKDVADSTAFAVNDFVGHVVGGFEFIKQAGLQLPEAFGDIAYRIGDKFYQGIAKMVRDAMVEINSFIDGINKKISGSGFELERFGLSKVGLNKDGTQKHIANPYAGAADHAIGAFNDAMGRDYAGEWFDSIRDKAVQLAKASTDAGKAMKDAAADAIDPWAGLRDVSESVKEQMRDLKRQSEATHRAWERFGDGATDIFSGLITHTTSWKEALASAIPLVKDLILNLMKAQSITGGSSQGGGLFGSLLSGIGGLFGLQMFPGGLGVASAGGFASMLGLAEGGQVRGPGTGTSDSILAMLSDGEFIVRSEVVKKPGVLPMLTALNEGIPRFAKGGGVSIPSLKSGNAGIVAVNDRAANRNSPLFQIIDMRTNAPAIEQEATTSPSGEQITRLIVRDEIKKSGVGSVAQFARNHAEAKKRSMIK